MPCALPNADSLTNERPTAVSTGRRWVSFCRKTLQTIYESL